MITLADLICLEITLTERLSRCSAELSATQLLQERFRKEQVDHPRIFRVGKVDNDEAAHD